MEGHDPGGSVALAWPAPQLPPPASPAPPRPASWRGVATAALVVAVALAFADASIVVLALPEIYTELDTTIVGVSWVITAYALVVGVGALLLAPLARKVHPPLLVGFGLALFSAASLGAGLAGSASSLLLARCGQGAGAAMLLGASLPVLSALRGSRAAGMRLWAAAGIAGAVIGPALGGLLTQLLDWRAIFLVQAPVAALALIVAIRPPPSRARRHDAGHAGDGPCGRGRSCSALVGAASVGALFLGVLLVVEVWRYEPLTGALVVSALPVAALLARRGAGWAGARDSAGRRRGPHRGGARRGSRSYLTRAPPFSPPRSPSSARDLDSQLTCWGRWRLRRRQRTARPPTCRSGRGISVWCSVSSRSPPRWRRT